MKICDFTIGENRPLFLIAGPCVIETEKIAFETAEHLKRITDELNINYVYKSSFSKANRSSLASYRGPGIEKGLKILQAIKDDYKIPVITDVHEDTPINEVAEVVDMLQTPALLCRQTNYIQNVVSYNLPVNIKKGQFLSPYEMKSVVEKAKSTGNNNILVCERGYSFGYNNLVVDMRSLVIMRATKCPVVFDATHSVQLPGSKGGISGGERQFIAPLAQAAVGVGISGLYMETHPEPEKALCDGPNSYPLKEMKALLVKLMEIDKSSKEKNKV